MKTALAFVKFYVWNVLIAFDQFCNAVLGGDPIETISRRAGAASLDKKGWACLLCRLLDYIDPRHCQSALERVMDNPGGSSVPALIVRWRQSQRGSPKAHEEPVQAPAT